MCFLASVDGLTLTTQVIAGANVVPEEQIVPTDGVALCEDQAATFATTKVAHQDHLHCEDKAIRALYVLVWLVDVEGVHGQIACSFHGKFDPASIGKVNHQREHGLLGRVDDIQLHEEPLQFFISEKNVPRSKAQTEWHIPKDEICTQNTHISLILIK